MLGAKVAGSHVLAVKLATCDEKRGCNRFSKPSMFNIDSLIPTFKGTHLYMVGASTPTGKICITNALPAWGEWIITSREHLGSRRDHVSPLTRAREWRRGVKFP